MAHNDLGFIEDEQDEDFGFVPDSGREVTAANMGGVPAAAIGGGVVESARRAASAAAPKLKNLAADAEFMALGGKNTKEGKDFLAREIAEEGSFAPREVGRASLDQGGIGTKSAVKHRDDLSDIIGTQSRERGAYLERIPGDIPVSQTFEAAEKSLGLDRLDPTNPQYQDLTDALGREHQANATEMHTTRTPKEMEELKVQLQNEAERSGAYGQTSRAEAASSKLAASRARAAKDAVEEAVLAHGGEDALGAFRESKRAIGKNAVAMKILEQRALKDATSGFSFASPVRSIEKIAHRYVPGTVAKGLDSVGKFASKAEGKLARKLPVVGAGIGGFLGYQAARAGGAGVADSLVAGAGDAVASADPTGLFDATPAGPAPGSPEAMLESGDRAGFFLARAPDRLKGALQAAAAKGPAALETTHSILMQKDPEYRRAIYGGEQAGLEQRGVAQSGR